MIDAYVLPKQAELREKIKNTQSEDERTALYDEIYKLQYLKRLLETTVGIISGTTNAAITQGTLQMAATKMREETLANSRKFKGIKDKDGETILTNVSYDSGYFDGVKLGGVRMNYDVLCGASNERCETDENGRLKLNEKGHVVYHGDLGEKPLYPTITKLLEDIETSKKLFGATGGFQAIGGEMFGSKYQIGSFFDRATEAYAGQHDLIGGQAFFYDEQGNGKCGLTEKQTFWIDRTSEAAVIGATPTTIPHALSLEVMFLLFGVR